MYFPAGWYRFHLAGDDGYRLWVDGNLLIDEWHDQSYTEKTADRYLLTGNHAVQIEYYEHLYDARVSFWWEQMQFKVFLPFILNVSGQESKGQSTPTPTTPPKTLVPTPTRQPYPKP